MSKVINRYRLLKDLPKLKAGVIFEHREWDKKFPDRGNIGCGCLINAWGKGGICAGGWCAESYVFPGQVKDDKEWFQLISNYSPDYDTLLAENKELRARLDSIAEHLIYE
jgi:hypothetical protein